jgi:predicted DNA-binding transcriptional regulator AlpA
MPQRTWTIEEIRELGLVTNVETAGSILGLSRTQAYAAIQRNEFPVPVYRVGEHRIRVPVQPILKLLGIKVAENVADDDQHKPPDRPACSAR